MRYPLYMTFFSTPDKLEIGGMPFVTAADKPTRREALTYYRRVAENFGLAWRRNNEGQAVGGRAAGSRLTARHPGTRGPEPARAAPAGHAPGASGLPN